MIVSVAALVALRCLAGRVVAQDKPLFYPTKTVTIVVPDGPGGSTDAVGHLMATELEEMWCQTVFVNNRTGDRDLADTAIVPRATPDGHTLVLSVSGIAVRRLGLTIG